MRAATALKKVVLRMKTNAIAFNPMEPFNFSVANEDSNCYSFDMRKVRAPCGAVWVGWCVCRWGGGGVGLAC